VVGPRLGRGAAELVPDLREVPRPEDPELVRRRQREQVVPRPAVLVGLVEQLLELDARRAGRLGQRELEDVDDLVAAGRRGEQPGLLLVGRARRSAR
jgi:hypothetical protein